MPDKYLYAGTEVLVNKFKIKDAVKLERLTRPLTELAAADLPSSGAFSQRGFDRLRAIHKQLFDEVYAWAGDPRTVSLSKPDIDGGRLTQFSHPSAILETADRTFAALNAEDNLKGLSPTLFAERAADYYKQLNDLHPFREGNGRTQREFFKQLAKEAGHHLDLTNTSSERFIEASVQASRGDLSGLCGVFRDAIEPDAHRLLTPVIAELRAHEGDNWTHRHVDTVPKGVKESGTLALVGESAYLVTADSRIRVFHSSDIPVGAKAGQTTEVTATWEPGLGRSRGPLAGAVDVYKAGGIVSMTRMMPAEAPRFAELERSVTAAQEKATRLGLSHKPRDRFVDAARERGLHRIEHGISLDITSTAHQVGPSRTRGTTRGR